MASDDLNEFQDYLDEFKNILHFDDETCQVCGIKPSENINHNRIALIELEFRNESEAKKAVSLLEAEGISLKVTSSKEKILIPETKLDLVKSVLNSSHGLQ